MSRLDLFDIESSSTANEFYTVTIDQDDVRCIKTDATTNLISDVSLTQNQKDDIRTAADQAHDDAEATALGLIRKVTFGLKADLPAAGQPSGEERFYIATDTGEWFYDDATNWVPMWEVDPAPGVPGLRTIGPGPNQVAPGDHRSLPYHVAAPIS